MGILPTTPRSWLFGGVGMGSDEFVCNFGHWNFDIVCSLVLVIWDFTTYSRGGVQDPALHTLTPKRSKPWTSI